MRIDKPGFRVAVLGGGPAGLYFACLFKQRHPEAQIRVLEQNPRDATFGFGVVFSERALEFLRDDDPVTHDSIAPEMEHWRDITLAHRGERIRIDGVGFSGIGRLHLLQLLQQRVRELGVEPEFGRVVRSLDELGEADLIVGADGLNSLVRRSFESEFGASLHYLDNKFAWYGTAQRFDSLTLTFVRTDEGHFTAHHYRYSPSMSTFIVECDRATWDRVGFAKMSEAESSAFCARVFADTLGGHPLVTNNSVWRNFPVVKNERWWHGNAVLVGDALHTAHFSIGSGTRLALEDVIALVKALDDSLDLDEALARYEATRRPVLEKLVSAAEASARWHENFPAHMELSPREFAMSYITRSGRVDLERLRQMAPEFMAKYG